MSSFRKPLIFSPFPNVIAAESTRHGGVSSPPYHSLNLGIFTDDSKADIAENRKRFFNLLQISQEKVAWSFQCHGDKILKVDHPVHADGYDALITNQPDIYLSVTIADCTPVLIYDPSSQSLAAIHAGWKGSVAGIVRKTIQAMIHHYQAKPENCHAFIGTCIDGRSYEVGWEVADLFPSAHKIWNKDRGKFTVDLKVANKTQLLEMGIPDSQIEISPFSTYIDNEDFFSHRKEKGITGRMLAIIGQRKIV